MIQPEIVDNLAPDTSHLAALQFLIQDLPTEPVSVATGYVNLGGLHHLAMAVADQRGVRLLIGAQPDPALGAKLPIGVFQSAIESLRDERDIARFPPSRLASRLGDIAGWLDDPTIEVRSTSAGSFTARPTSSEPPTLAAPHWSPRRI